MTKSLAVTLSEYNSGVQSPLLTTVRPAHYQPEVKCVVKRSERESGPSYYVCSEVLSVCLSYRNSK